MVALERFDRGQQFSSHGGIRADVALPFARHAIGIERKAWPCPLDSDKVFAVAKFDHWPDAERFKVGEVCGKLNRAPAKPATVDALVAAEVGPLGAIFALAHESDHARFGRVTVIEDDEAIGAHALTAAQRGTCPALGGLGDFEPGRLTARFGSRDLCWMGWEVIESMKAAARSDDAEQAGADVNRWKTRGCLRANPPRRSLSQVNFMKWSAALGVRVGRGLLGVLSCSRNVLLSFSWPWGLP